MDVRMDGRTDGQMDEQFLRILPRTAERKGLNKIVKKQMQAWPVWLSI